jgi:hypothetical protein
MTRFGGYWQLGLVFESLRYRWTSKEVKGIALAVVLLAAVASWAFWRTLTSGAMVSGIVVSTGAVSVGRVCGGTREVASVRLPDGRVVYASVDSGRPLLQGTHVSLQKQGSQCNPVTYEVVALQ